MMNKGRVRRRTYNFSFSASQTVDLAPKPSLTIVLNRLSKTWPGLVGWKRSSRSLASNSSSIGSFIEEAVDADRIGGCGRLLVMQDNVRQIERGLVMVVGALRDGKGDILLLLV